MTLARSFLNANQVASLISSAVRQKTPFSFVRLGDGEGALLGFTPKSRLEDIAYLALHFGQLATLDDIYSVREALIEAITSADLVGIRDDVNNACDTAKSIDVDSDDFLNHFCCAFPVRNAERSYLDPHGARRLFSLWRWLTDNPGSTSWQTCSSWVTADLQLQDYWQTLIADQAKIGLINHSKSLAERLSNRFGVEVDFVQVPPNEIDRGQNGPPSDWSKQHAYVWPQISLSLPANLDGQIFIVAAGLIGKNYCRIIKARGGIALDIGAQVDAWDGYATRTLVYKTKTPLTYSQFGPPPEFQLGILRRARAVPFDKRITLHLGFSKTGTTSIQIGMTRREAELAAANVRYVRAGRMEGTDINHHQLARALGMGERQYDKPSAPPDINLSQQLLSQIADEIASTNFGTYLLSSELFSNFGMNRLTEDLFVEWLQTNNVMILTYVRNQFDWLVSWYTQAAKNGNMGLWLDEFLEDPHQLPNSERFDGNFLRKIALFEKWVGKDRILVLSYDDEIARSGLVQGFFERLGLSAAGSDYEIRENAGPDDLLLIERIVSRRIGLPDHCGTTLGRVGTDFGDRALLRGAFATKREHLRSKIMNRFSDINAELLRRYNVEIKSP